MHAVSQQSSGLTRAVVTTGDDLARTARRRRWWWALLVVVLVVGAVLAGQALWDWHHSAAEILPGQPIPS
jgi:hypothetical protein